jgi:dihydrofolate reductase
MRKIALLMHVSLDGFVAGPNGEMGWIKLNEELFDYVSTVTAKSDTAIYGEVTFHMMENYWPTAGDKPNASKHDIDHSRWSNNVLKIVVSKTLEKTDWQNTLIIHDNVEEEIVKLKSQPGKDMLMIGSPTLAHYFMDKGLFDELYINVNPVVLGEGKPLFKDSKEMIKLKLLETKTFDEIGVVALHYEVLKEV